MNPRTPPQIVKVSSFLADTSPPHTEVSAATTSLSSSGHKGPHRSGFSVNKCRDVLVRQCGWIPRNYIFKDGVNQVYEVLREYLGDENLDLAIAQLNELIEIPSQWPHDEGASFQAWRHDYMLRHKDFENSHVPRLKNIIVAPVNPTERLKKWREGRLDRQLVALPGSQSSQKASSSNEIRPTTPDYGIGVRVRGGNWRLENAFFVSSKTQGTRVLHCPSAQELHKNTWNQEFGRGGKLIHERIVNLGELMDDIEYMPDQAMPLKRKKSVADLLSIRSFPDVPVLHWIQSVSFRPDNLNNPLQPTFSSRVRRGHSKQASNKPKRPARKRRYYLDPLLGRFVSEVKIYEGNPSVRNLPDPESDAGKSYYSKITTWPLPPETCVPSPRFARKHDLVPDEIPLPGGVAIKLVPTADEVAIERNFQNTIGFNSLNSQVNLGPFTPELFKDGGIDFPQNWGNVEREPSDTSPRAEAPTDMGTLGDAAQSPSKCPIPINKKLQRLSSFCTKVDSEQQELLHLPSETVPHASKFSVCLWYCFRWKMYPESTYAQKMLSLFGHYHSWTTLATPFMNLAIMEYATSDQLSVVRMSRSRSLGGNNSKAGKKHKSFLLWAMLNSGPIFPVDGTEDYSTKKYDHEKAISRKGYRIYQTDLIVAENFLIMQAMTNSQGPSMIKENTEGKFTLKIVMEMLQWIGHAYLEKLLTRGPLGIKKVTRSQSNHKNNTNNKRAQASNKREQNKLDNLSGILSQSELEISLALIHKKEELTKRRSNHKRICEMDLNRDLPPLPFTTGSQHLQLGDKAHRRSLHSEANFEVKLLQPLYYDPVRDSFKYGGFHYHPDGMRYHPEVPQHPPRTSSMPRNDVASASNMESINNQFKTRDHLNRSPIVNKLAQDTFGSTHASHAKHGSEGSSGFLGNFIPVKKLAIPSAITTRAVHVPRIETDSSMWVPTQHSKPKFTPEKANSQILACSPKNQKNDNSFGKYSDSVGFQRIEGGAIARSVDHHSIDINDPEALTKYIQHLKMMKKQNIEAKKQPLQPSSSPSKQLDNEAGRSINNINSFDRTFIGPCEDTEDPRFIAQDYSEIRAGNPFRLDSNVTQNDPNRITTFTDFIGRAKIVPQQSNKVDHLRNSHSGSDEFHIKKRQETTQNAEHNNTPRHVLQRSSSSPSPSPTTDFIRHGGAQDSLQSFYEEDDPPYHQTVNRGRYLNDSTRSPVYGDLPERTSSKQHGNIPGNQETAIETFPPSQKRPWSPVKMIFGEGGWLSSTANSKDESTTPKKPSLVEKIKLKIEEIGLKADLSPIKSPFRNEHEKSSEQSTFPISLSPSQQAELYLDIELLICDSANTFLMNEYHNGRMSVESLKKVTDFWRSKGRPQVVEFHYDQITQRDLIVANQKTFHFYGPNASNTLKIHSMLYAWKTNAREMAVRTFCYPDSMIRKHIGDTFVILDFLGGHPFQYIAAHEVQKKLVGWINEAHVRMVSRLSGTPDVQKGSNESPTEMVLGNPWHSAGKPIQRHNKQSSSSGNDQLSI